MPVGYVLIGDARGDVKHDDGTLSCGRNTTALNTEASNQPYGVLKRDAGKSTLDIIAISQAPELLLTGSVPNVEFNVPSVGVEKQWVDFDPKGS